MKYIKGQDRNQMALFPVSTDEAIEQDHEVRIIDLFVETLDIESMGFKLDHTDNGRPAYHPKDLEGYLRKVLALIFALISSLKPQISHFKTGLFLRIIFFDIPVVPQNSLYLPEIN